MKTQHLFLFGLLSASVFALSNSASAEYGCQAGHIPVYQGLQQVCVADYNLPHWQNKKSSQHKAKWATRWGAIATNNAGVAGIVESKSSKRKAEQGALADCKKRGGGDACKLVFSYHNQCAAVSSGRKGTMYSHAATEEIAVKNSLSKCEIEKGGDCHLYYSGCSLAERKEYRILR